MRNIDIVRKEINESNNKYFLRTLNNVPTIFYEKNKIATLDNIEHCKLSFANVMARTHFAKEVSITEKEEFYKMYKKIRWQTLQKINNEGRLL